jgi:Ankyrin repeats (3 copies)
MIMRSSSRAPLCWVLALYLVALTHTCSAAKAQAQAQFLLRDQHDGKCLAGSEFKRCGADTLWHVSGKASEYLLHLRDTETGADMCLDKAQCDSDSSALTIGSCSKTCARAWNILGDDTSGYVLTDGEKSERCLKREGDAASIVPCADSNLTLTFTLVKAADITAMGRPAAQFSAAAAAGDQAAVQRFIDEGADVNGKDWEGVPVLSAAASAGHLDIVKLLISKVGMLDAQFKHTIMHTTMHMQLKTSLLSVHALPRVLLRSCYYALYW